MILRRTYKFHAYPVPRTAEALTRAIGRTRLDYNLALKQRRTFGRRGRRLDSSAEPVALNRNLLFSATDAFSQFLQQALRDFDTAYKAFFEGRAGCPTPRRKFVHDSMRFPQPYIPGEESVTRYKRRRSGRSLRPTSPPLHPRPR